ncbi:MAG: peptide chain release factor N(5)-glutamine methyltransferase [Candidatus Moraniibacteriota bacterium]
MQKSRGNNSYKPPCLTIHEALRLSTDLPRLDREVLLSHTLGQDRVFLMAHGETKLTPNQLKRYRDFLARATKHEPIAYIVGEREFYGRDFSVGPGVLIPRPETELLVEQVLNRILNQELRIKNKNRSVAIVDVGTGSGCIIISLSLSLKQSRLKNISFFAVDNESAALHYARKNARHHHVDADIRFVKSDLLTRVKNQLSRYDEISVLANLPYLSTALYRTTAPNVRQYEPASALVSGPDGLAHYRRLLKALQALAATGTKVHFFLEISPEQVPLLPALFADTECLSPYSIHPDLAGSARVVSGTIAVSA